MSQQEIEHLPRTVTLKTYKETVRLIDSGRKGVEIRVKDSVVDALVPGDFLKFDKSSTRELLITRVATYGNIEEAMKVEDARRVMPGFSTQEIIRYFRFGHSPKQRNMPVVALEWNPETRYR